MGLVDDGLAIQGHIGNGKPTMDIIFNTKPLLANLIILKLLFVKMITGGNCIHYPVKNPNDFTAADEHVADERVIVFDD